jgi:FAD/FMN-containing dehydrogenase
VSGSIEVPSQDPRFHAPPVGRERVDVRALEHELRRATEGEVRFSAGDRALYSATGANYRQVPIGVVIPRSVDDVVETVRLCREHRAPLLSRGGGTGLAGQTTNVAVVIDFSKYLNRVLEIDPESRLARVEPGLILDHLREQAESEHQLTFGPDPSTHEYCTFGGMIASNSCGVRSIMAQFYGPGPRTSDNVHELEVLLYDGRRLRAREGTSGDPEIDRRLLELRDRYADLIRERYPKIPRRVSGYNLDDLLPENGFHVARALAGTESTCVTYLEATVHLLYSPPARSLLVLGYEDAPTAADNVPKALEHKPLGLEGMDEGLVDDMTQLRVHIPDLSALPDGHGWLLLEFGGDTREEADDKARQLMSELKVGRDGLLGMRDSARPPSSRGRRTRTRGGRTRPFHPSGSAATCATSASSLTGTATRAPSTATTATAASTPAGTSTSPASPGLRSTAHSSRRPPTSSSPTAARSRASTATASPAPSCCRRCSAPS